MKNTTREKKLSMPSGNLLKTRMLLLAAATSDAAFAFIDGLLTSLIGDLVLFLASWAIFYHMLGRLRHVVWDFGYCLDIKISEKLGWGMFAGATVLALIAAIVL